ncbi:hypothetical protein BC828DRAFT_378628 [Blastocladiella britannica]|nr:hypothetical protein BC828DRAFT_378628 [Blastocladiella britannica]
MTSTIKPISAEAAAAKAALTAVESIEDTFSTSHKELQRLITHVVAGPNANQFVPNDVLATLEDNMTLANMHLGAATLQLDVAKKSAEITAAKDALTRVRTSLSIAIHSIRRAYPTAAAAADKDHDANDYGDDVEDGEGIGIEELDAASLAPAVLSLQDWARVMQFTAAAATAAADADGTDASSPKTAESNGGDAFPIPPAPVLDLRPCLAALHGELDTRYRARGIPDQHNEDLLAMMQAVLAGNREQNVAVLVKVASRALEDLDDASSSRQYPCEE